MKKTLQSVFLWWAVIGFSLWVGGTFYNMVVIVPIWSESPPDSVIQFFGETSYNKHIYNFFGPPWMIARFFPIIASLILSWPEKTLRKYLLVTSIIFASAVAGTLIYIYPINDLLISRAGAGLSAEEIKIMANQWIYADQIRFGFMLIAYVFLLKAFRLQLSK